MAAGYLLGVGAIGKEQVFLIGSFGGGGEAVVSSALAAQIWALIWRRGASAFAMAPQRFRTGREKRCVR